MLIVTMVTTIKKLATSPVAADSPLATSKMITSGLRKRERNCSQSGDRFTTAASLGPKVFSRDWTSVASRPVAVVTSRARSRSSGSFQISSAPSSSIAGFIAPFLKSSLPAGSIRPTSNRQIFIWRNHLDRCHNRCRRLSLLNTGGKTEGRTVRNIEAAHSLLGTNPPGDLRPVISQRVRSHEQPDMAARHGLLNDTILCSPDIFCGIKDLFRCRDVVVCTRQQIGGASDIVEIELPAEAHEFAFGKTILLEDLGDHLKIPASRQVNRIFVPALEGLFLREVCRVVDVLIEIDMILNVVLLGVHVLPALQHELALHQAPAKRHQLLVKRCGGLVDHLFDRAISGIRVDGRARQHQ